MNETQKSKQCPPHHWEPFISSMWSNEKWEDGQCSKCGMRGGREIETGEVFWGTT